MEKILPLSHSIVLGIVQGLTELLPVSSSAHLALIPWVLRWEDPGLAFDVSLHLGTLLAVLVYFWNDLWEMLTGEERLRWITLLGIGTIPGAVAGVLLKHQAETTFRSPTLMAMTLIGAGVVLGWADRRAGDRPMFTLTLWDALLIGSVQALALVPGVSRSAMTIMMGLFLGLDRTSAARFSFLLSIPIIAGAGIIEVPKLMHSGLSLSFLTWGFLASAVAGLAAIHFLMRLVQTRSYMPFVIYRILAGGLIFLRLATLS